jgi:MerC mercury resistance protein
MSNELMIAPRDAWRILDAFGMAGSLLCAVHCAVTPAIMSLLPLAGLECLGVETTEYGLVGLSATLGFVSLTMGYRRHRSRRAIGVLSGGLALLALGRITDVCGVESVGVVSAVTGGCIVAAAHVINRRLCQTCGQCLRQTEPVGPPVAEDSSDGSYCP